MAAVKISSVRRKAAQKFWAPQQGHPHPPSPRPPCLKGLARRSRDWGIHLCAALLVPKNASGGSLSFTSERKGGKNAAKTNGFGFLARAWYGKYRGLSAPRMKQYKSVPCFRIVSDSIHRDALRACAARPNRAALCVYRAGRCGHRPLRNPIGKPSVGADAHIGPTGFFPHPRQGTRAPPYKMCGCRAGPMCPADHRTTCNAPATRSRAVPLP